MGRANRQDTYVVHAEVVADAVLPPVLLGPLRLVGVVSEPLVELLQSHRVVWCVLEGSVDEFGVRRALAVVVGSIWLGVGLGRRALASEIRDGIGQVANVERGRRAAVG